MIKADLHIHTNLDPEDGLKGKNFVDYSPKKLIDKASRLGFTHLSFTHHNKLIFPEKIKVYAKTKGITLIKGVEATIEGKHVVLLNPSKEIVTFKQLKEEKKNNKNLFVVAPHPFYPMNSCLNNLLVKHIDLFDGIELCSFNSFLIKRYNKKAMKIARKYNKPLIATSDSHKIKRFGHNYIIGEEKELFSALKNKKFKNVNGKLSIKDFLGITYNFAKSVLFN